MEKALNTKVVTAAVFAGLTYGGNRADWGGTITGITFGLAFLFTLMCLAEAIGWIAVEIRELKIKE